MIDGKDFPGIPDWVWTDLEPAEQIMIRTSFGNGMTTALEMIPNKFSGEEWVRAIYEKALAISLAVHKDAVERGV